MTWCSYAAAVGVQHLRGVGADLSSVEQELLVAASVQQLA